MNNCILNKVFLRFIGYILYYADPEFLARSIGLRESNSKTFWIQKNVTQVVEDAFGKEHFSPEYTDTKDVLGDTDYLGSILKTGLSSDIQTFYLKRICITNEYRQFTSTVEKYVRNNPKEILRLFVRIICGELRRLPGRFYRFVMDKIDSREKPNYKRYILKIASLYKNKEVGIAVGLDRAYQMNYFKPIISAFVARGINFLFICEAEKARDKSFFKEEENYLSFKVKLPTSAEVFKKEEYRQLLESDSSLLKNRITASPVEGCYKKFIIDRLDRHLRRYYKIRYFFDELIKNVDFKFVFALPDRFDFQRTALMLCKKKGVPTFTYEAYFHTAETVLVWYYFSDWVILANKKYIDLTTGYGFSKGRLFQAGSTLADYYVNNSKEEALGDVLNVLLLTKPARRSGFKIDAIIDETIAVFERLDLKYNLYIKPHPADKDLYYRYAKKNKNKVSVLGRQEPLYKYVTMMHCLVAAGITGAVLECLPCKKPIITVELTSSTDMGLFYRDDLRKIAPIFKNLKDFNLYFTNLILDIMRGNREEIEIPKSLIDDFYCSLDGRTKDRVVDFVFSKTSERSI